MLTVFLSTFLDWSIRKLKNRIAKFTLYGRDGGQVVSALAFYSDDSSSNHADAYSYFHRREKNIIKQETKYNG